MRRITILQLAFFFTLLIPIATYAAGPEPPAGLLKIYEKFATLEEQYEAENWLAARTVNVEILKKFNTLVPSLLMHTNSAKIEKFRHLSMHLDAALKKKSKRNSEKNYIKLQNAIFEIINIYHYKVHPLFAIIKRYIVEETVESLKKEDFDDVISEMKEIASFLLKAKKLFVERGISEEDFRDFDFLLNRVRVAAVNQNKDDAEKYLNEAIKIYTSFLARAAD